MTSNLLTIQHKGNSFVREKAHSFLIDALAVSKGKPCMWKFWEPSLEQKGCHTAIVAKRQIKACFSFYKAKQQA